MLKVAVWLAESVDELTQKEVDELCEFAGTEPVLEFFSHLNTHNSMDMLKQIAWALDYAKTEVKQ